MKTNTFLKRISKIFTPDNKIMKNMETENQSENPVQVTPVTQNSGNTSNLTLTPTVPVIPAASPVSMAVSESQRIKSNDLGSWALDQCIAVSGNLQGLLSSLEIVIMNYKLEARAKEEELKVEMTNAINGINDEVISLNNQIAIIREFHIPEKERQILQLEEQMGALENNTLYDLQTDLGNETYTILATSKARTREIIRKLQTKIVDLQTSIHQLENKLKTMRGQMESINLFNEDIILRRMHIFFDGWLKGLEGIGAESTVLDETKSFFENYSKTKVNNLLNN